MHKKMTPKEIELATNAVLFVDSLIPAENWDKTWKTIWTEIPKNSENLEAVKEILREHLPVMSESMLDAMANGVMLNYSGQIQD